MMLDVKPQECAATHLSSASNSDVSPSEGEQEQTQLMQQASNITQLHQPHPQSKREVREVTYTVGKIMAGQALLTSADNLQITLPV